MKRVWQWIQKHLKLWKMSRAEAMYRQWRGDVERVTSELDRYRRRLVSIRRQLEMIGEAVSEDLEEVQLLAEQKTRVVDELNAELEILKNTTVPGLVAANHLVITQLDAQTAIQERQRVAALPTRGE